METRKQMKKNARGAIKRHHLIYIIACFFAAIIGTEFAGSLQLFRQSSEDISIIQISYNGAIINNQNFYDIMIDDYQERAQNYDESIANRDPDSPVNKILDRRNGVLATMVNGVSSGSFFATILVAIRNVTGSKSIAAGIFICGVAILLFFFWAFIKNVYRVAMRRIFLEGVSYDKVPNQRFLYVFRIKCVLDIAITMFVLAMYKFLWSITIIGIAIKHYSYLMVPYIVAENPKIPSKTAINLSRKMMNGHKLQYFWNDITFLGWFVLDVVTFGMSRIVFTNAYRIAYFAECYKNLRQYAKEREFEGSEYLNDKYLFEKAAVEELNREYAAIGRLKECTGHMPEVFTHGVKGFMAKWFGISLASQADNDAYADYRMKKVRVDRYRAEMEQMAYPTRLHPIPEKQKNFKVTQINYMKLYSVTSIILLFFSFCITGWVWEVLLHIYYDGQIINRGFTHGPWLPIYGVGGVIIITLLKRFRDRPVLEFLVAFVLCGFIEYFTAWLLETVNGEKWWDYSGYFLNLDGRICAEGLLVFAVGGCTVVYLIAPLLDAFFKRIDRRIATVICVVLLAAFFSDCCYSFKHPNTGKGITEYEEISFNSPQ
jgi:uncharacterized membrane protein